MLLRKFLIGVVWLSAAGTATAAGAGTAPVPYNAAQIAGSGLAAGLAAEAGNLGWAWEQLVSGRAALVAGNEATPGLLYYVGISLIGFVMVGRRRDHAGSGYGQ